MIFLLVREEVDGPRNPIQVVSFKKTPQNGSCQAPSNWWFPFSPPPPPVDSSNTRTHPGVLVLRAFGSWLRGFVAQERLPHKNVRLCGQDSVRGTFNQRLWLGSPGRGQSPSWFLPVPRCFFSLLFCWAAEFSILKKTAGFLGYSWQKQHLGWRNHSNILLSSPTNWCELCPSVSGFPVLPGSPARFSTPLLGGT